MELNDENEPCTVNIPNEKILDQKLNSDDSDDSGVTVKKIEKKDVNVDDEEDDVDIDEDLTVTQTGNMCILAENSLCDKGEDEWLIDEDSDHSLEFDLSLSTSKEYKEDKNTNSKSPKFTSGSKINEPIPNVKETKEESDVQKVSPEMIRHLQKYTNLTLNEIYRPPHSIILGPTPSTNLPGPSSSTSIPGPSGSINLPGPSSSINLPGPSSSNSIPDPSGSINLPGPSSSINLPGPSSSTSIPGPSCSTNLSGSINLPGPTSSINLPGPSSSTSIAGPSGSINLPGPSSSTSIPGPSCSTGFSGSPCGFSSRQFPSLLDDEDLDDINLSKKQQVLLISSFYNKMFMNDCGKQENSELNQDIEISNLEDCDYVKHYISEYTNLKISDEEPETENTEYFVEDPDIVNPDIMYNIDLNEYYNELDLLALKVLKTPDDPTGLVEYNQLPPIPQIEQTRRKFTRSERFRFANGIMENEYQIDRDDWNKIMVKRSVVFTAHAGFSIANEESLYVLADVAIDYVKKLALIMKKHFDIQANSPYPDSVDPIDNSLQEIGVKGGIRELIEHYENDVFGRRNKLLKKCQHLKKVIDRQINDIIKPQNVNPEDFEEEYLTNEVEENILSKEMDAITEEEKTEIESGIEEVIIETQYCTDENIFIDTEIEQIDPIYVDSTDFEVKINNGSKNIKNIKTNAMNIKDKKINSSKIPDSDNLKEFDLLKPLVDPTEYTKYGHSGGKEKITECKQPCASESDPDPPKPEKSLDLGTPKKVMKYLYSPLEVSPQVQLDVPVEDENDLGLSRMTDQLDEDFETSFTDDNVQTIYVHTMSDIDEAMSLYDDNADNYLDNTVQIIPVANENDDSDSNIDYDIVSVHSFI
ncbi:uncharacterized protein LOC100165925 [Acyrthosiphon pisum]|uniref:Bromodomain associated domain-containing protein n=1 Tax=Acyrthosiphon pisum TaxID=7029 RepID=A0A8R1W602_ACYPI|nr:uncharacterized protein LOC100165925 [Acyrthosiphon pisum]XP_016656388.1 uncharacterized protein LOC100165925 [Acyrthosiphon pisum]|eukprot:XP_001950899.2 PREDICTED: uncharacterized protein LOC100165925 [Acyrthosiphon pisum]